MPTIYAIVKVLGGWRAAAFAAALLAVMGFAGVQSVRLSAAHSQLSKAETEAARQAQDALMSRLAAESAARAKEQERADSVNRIAAAYERGKRDAETLGQRTEADLRAGSLQFKRLWQGCQADAAARVSGAAGDSGEPDAADGLRAASAGRIVRAVKACQVERDALLNIAEDDRK